MVSLKLLTRLSVAPLLLFALASCNDSSTLSSKDRKNPPKEDKEDEEADTPVEVSGSFLTCDWVGDPAEEGDTVVGCAVVNKNGETLEKTNRTFDLTLHNSDDKSVEMVSTDAPADSEWHKLAKLPASNRDTGYLKMNTTKSGSPESSFKLNTYDIGKSISLGNASGEEIKEETPEATALTSITTHGQWIDKFKARMGLKMSDFCETDGTVRKTLSVESDVMVTLADQLLKTSTTNKNIIVKDTKISTSSAVCFVPFREQGADKDIAHQNSQQSCFYLHTGTNLHIISVKKAQAENPDFNLENLKKFASSKPCP